MDKRKLNNIKKKIEENYNKGFKEYNLEEAFEKMGFIKLEGSNVVNAEELKNNLNSLIDGVVIGAVEEINLQLKANRYIKLDMKVKDEVVRFNIRLGVPSA